jgi:hypothetical protein
MGSPAQLGQLHCDVCVMPTDLWDWGMARSCLWSFLLVAPMPTASTSQTVGNDERFEPYTRYVPYVVNI